MDDFDVKNHDQEIDDLLSEVKGLLGEEPEEDESVGVSTIIANDARPIPIPARAKDSIVSFFAFIPDSPAQTAFPPRNFCLRPVFRI